MTHLKTKIKNRDRSSGKYRISLAILMALVLMGPGIAFAGTTERILDFYSHIEVHEDGHLIVTERIEVVAAGRQIKRGIYRDFPTIYKNRSGKKIRVGFKILGVLKNDRPEAYHTASRTNGKRVYIGRKNVYLKPGTYTYTITYRTDRQLGFFKDHDELYWNVTGNDWQFSIEKAGATVLLPSHAEVIEATAYTGRRGAKGKAFAQGYDESGNVTFETTRSLRSGEGLTIAVAWPKGVVAEPSLKDKLSFAARDNAGTIAAVAGCIVLFIYYLMAWIKVGRDPRKGPIIPLFHPPEGFSPAAIRHVQKMGFDNKSFAAALVDMAVKGALTISEDSDGVFTVKKNPNVDLAVLSKGEKKLLSSLFKSQNILRLENSNHAEIRAAISVLKKTLNTDLEKVCFVHNTTYLIPGVAITIISLVAIILTAKQISTAVFMSVWLSIWTVACAMLVLKVIGAFRQSESRLRKKTGAVFQALFTIPFLIGEIAGLWMFTQAVSFQAAVFFIGLILLTPLFYHLLKAPTLYGRTILDKIEGFRQYLSIAETDRLEILNPPEKTPALFEKMLPYAMALDVENDWGKQFADVLDRANDGAGYRTSWYMSHSPGFTDVGSLSANLSQGLAGAVSSAATAPGSSSGFGGGGSSGGGGGGGGGGGW